MLSHVGSVTDVGMHLECLPQISRQPETQGGKNVALFFIELSFSRLPANEHVSIYWLREIIF